MPVSRRGLKTSAAAIRQGAEKRLDIALLNARLLFNWIARYKTPAGGRPTLLMTNGHSTSSFP